MNLPSFVVGALLASPMGGRPGFGEYAAMALSALVSIPLWCFVGSQLDHGVEAKRVRYRTALGSFFFFDFVCLASALTSHGFAGLGILIWIAFPVVLFRLRSA
jgi:hypothetical protein